MFTLIHKLSISELIHCKITHQWNKPVRQCYRSQWSLQAEEMTEPWQTEWEQRGLDTDLAAHMKLAAALHSTSAIKLVLCIKDHGFRTLLRWQNPSSKHRNYYMGSSSWAVNCWDLWGSGGRERSEYGGDMLLQQHSAILLFPLSWRSLDSPHVERGSAGPSAHSLEKMAYHKPCAQASLCRTWYLEFVLCAEDHRYGIPLMKPSPAPSLTSLTSLRCHHTRRPNWRLPAWGDHPRLRRWRWAGFWKELLLSPTIC